MADGRFDGFIYIEGTVSTEYVASESPAAAYLSLHLALARMRLLSQPADAATGAGEMPGPRVMVVGERGAGKSTLVKTLTNWAVREARARQSANDKTAVGPLVINLDVASDNSVAVPGTLSVTPARALLPTSSAIATFGSLASSGPPVPFPQSPGDLEPNIDTYAPPVNALVFWHGYLRAGANPALFEALLTAVGRAVNSKIEHGGLAAWRAGVIVDTPSEWLEKRNVPTLARAARELEVNTLFVLGNERQFVEVNKAMASNKSVKVLRVPRNDGVGSPPLSSPGMMS